MKRWAQIKGGMVATVVEQDGFPSIDGPWVECTGQSVGPGFAYNGSVFAATAVAARKALTERAFWRRFTPAEREAMQNMLATGIQARKDKLNAFRDYVATGMKVELDDDYIIATVTLMETAGVLNAGRAAVILTTPVTDAEA